jgi:hypothetical protein
MFEGKKAIGTAYVWIYGLVSLFGLGLLYIVFDQVFLQYIVPIIKTQVNATGPYAIDQGTVSTIYYNIDKYMAFWHLLPFIIFLVIVIYMVLMGIRRERNEEYL